MPFIPVEMSTPISKRRSIQRNSQNLQIPSPRQDIALKRQLPRKAKSGPRNLDFSIYIDKSRDSESDTESIHTYYGPSPKKARITIEIPPLQPREPL
jgi:hypothetical protein